MDFDELNASISDRLNNAKEYDMSNDIHNRNMELLQAIKRLLRMLKGENWLVAASTTISACQEDGNNDPSDFYFEFCLVATYACEFFDTVKNLTQSTWNESYKQRLETTSKRVREETASLAPLVSDLGKYQVEVKRLKTEHDEINKHIEELNKKIIELKYLKKECLLKLKKRDSVNEQILAYKAQKEQLQEHCVRLTSDLQIYIQHFEANKDKIEHIKAKMQINGVEPRTFEIAMKSIECLCEEINNLLFRLDEEIIPVLNDINESLDKIEEESK